MNILFLGANNFVVNVAHLLKKSDHQITVISNEIQFNKKTTNGVSVRDELTYLQVKNIVINKLNDFKTNSVPTTNDTIVISFGAPWILSRQIIEDIFNNKIINIHGTHLPKYRGGTLFSWQILTGQRTGMCLLHQLTPEIDAGPILAFKEFIYPAYCRKPIDFIEEYEKKNTIFLLEFIDNWSGWPKTLHAQPEYLSTYWPRLLANVHGWIDWNWGNQDLERFILAFDEPYGGAKTRWENQVVIVRDVIAQHTEGFHHPFQYGHVIRKNDSWITIAVQGGELLIQDIKSEQGQCLLDKINVGDQLYSLASDLDATHKRVVKGQSGLTTKK